jgi:hypothetical protein
VRGKLRRFGWILLGMYPLVGTSAVLGSLFLEFTPSSAPAGTQVHARTPGNGDVVAAAGMTLDVFLARSDAGDPEDLLSGQLVALGSLVVDAGGNGSLTATVPSVPPGRYQVVIACPPCASTSGGRSMLPAGVFRVAPGLGAQTTPAGTEGSGASVGLVAVWVAIVAAVVAIAGVVARSRRRSGGS